MTASVKGDEKWIFSTGCKDVSTDFPDATLVVVAEEAGIDEFITLDSRTSVLFASIEKAFHDLS